jgi:hypothetical protein
VIAKHPFKGWYKEIGRDYYIRVDSYIGHDDYQQVYEYTGIEAGPDWIFHDFTVQPLRYIPYRDKYIKLTKHQIKPIEEKVWLWKAQEL